MFPSYFKKTVKVLKQMQIRKILNFWEKFLVYKMELLEIAYTTVALCDFQQILSRFRLVYNVTCN